MKILSRWKLTWDPGTGGAKVLLDFGDLIDEELHWKLGRHVEVVPLAAAAAPFIRPAGNNSYNLDFTVYKTEETDSAARTDIMDELRTVDDLAKKPLRLQIATEAGVVTNRYWQFSSAAIREMEVWRVTESSKPRFAQRFSIVAVTLNRVNS